MDLGPSVPEIRSTPTGSTPTVRKCHEAQPASSSLLRALRHPMLDPPTGAWPAYRLLGLPVFVLVLTGPCLLFHRFERPAGRSNRRSDAGEGVAH
jgi:hypothetical protein